MHYKLYLQYKSIASLLGHQDEKQIGSDGKNLF